MELWLSCMKEKIKENFPLGCNPRSGKKERQNITKTKHKLIKSLEKMSCWTLVRVGNIYFQLKEECSESKSTEITLITSFFCVTTLQMFELRNLILCSCLTMALGFFWYGLCNTYIVVQRLLLLGVDYCYSVVLSVHFMLTLHFFKSTKSLEQHHGVITYLWRQFVPL